VLVAVELVDATLIFISEFRFLKQVKSNLLNWSLLLVKHVSYLFYDTDVVSILIPGESMGILHRSSVGFFYANSLCGSAKDVQAY
jgi:hypothetical protein